MLLDRDGTVMLADFGVSGWLMEDGDRRKNRQVQQDFVEVHLCLL